MTDPISDLLTQIRNSSAIGKESCRSPFSHFKAELLAVLVNVGYLAGVEHDQEATELIISLIPGKIRRVARLSKPGRRLYVGYRDIPTVMRGYGTVIVSTPAGILTGKEAKRQKVGGELICELA